MTTPIPVRKGKKKKHSLIDDSLLNPVAYKRNEPKVSPPYREVTINERMQKRGWHQGLKHLISENFTDMEMMSKPAFGTAPINFEEEDVGCGNHDPSIDHKSQFLWGFVTKNILDQLLENEDTPYLIKTNNARLAH